MGTACFEPSKVPVRAHEQVIEQSWQHGELQLPVTVVSMGNPHCVAFSQADLDDLSWREWGAYWEYAPVFPNRSNVQVARRLSPSAVEIRIWERGAGETLASGSSSCAVAVAGVKTGRLRPGWIDVHMPGGHLKVHVDPTFKVLLRGPVELIGRFEVSESWLLARRGD